MVEQMIGVVMVLESVFPSIGGGGAEAQAATLGRWLIDRGIPVTLVVPMVAAGPQTQRESIDGIEVVRIAYPKWRIVGSLVLLLRLMLFLFRQRDRFSAIHAHIGNNMAVVATLTGRLLGKPVLIKMTGMTEMQGGVLDESADATTRIKRRLMHRATAIQATSRQIAACLARTGFAEDRVHWLPNAVDLERFDPARPDAASARERAHPDQDFVAIYVGRLEPEKGVELLLDAWSDAFRETRRVRLVVVGEGTLQESMMARAAKLGIAEQVVFTGRSSRVESHLAAADVGVLASHAEGLSNTMLETMASGLPMIGSRVSGADDFIEPGRNGWLFEPGDRQALAQALRDACLGGRGELRRMGARARLTVQGRASMPVIGERLLCLYGMTPPTPCARPAGEGS